MSAVKEIYNALFQGKTVSLVAQCSQDPEIVKLINHLNVMKSRTKTIMKSLDLNWDNKVISINPPLKHVEMGTRVTIQLTEPKPVKQYSINIDNNA